MIFERLWPLLFAWLPLAWASWEWRGSSRRVALALKALALTCVLAAFSQPRLKVFESKMAVAILVDTSASVPAASLAAASTLATNIENGRGRHWTRVIPFARSTRNAAAGELNGSSWNLRPTASAGGRATNLEAALREAVAALPAGLIPRVVLISDGNENLGSVVRAAWQVRQLGVPVDTWPIAGKPQPALRLESVNMPAEVFAGERFPIDISLISPAKASVSVEIRAENKPVGSSAVEIVPGVNTLKLHTSLSAVGATDVAGKISAAGLGEVTFEHAVTIRRPQAALVSQDPIGSEAPLLKTLEANQFDVRRFPNGLPDELSNYQLVLINNWDAEAIPPARKARLEEFVKQGGGLLWIAGERNVYIENKKIEDALDRTLPAKLAPPRSPEGTLVILIVDKSSSMEGKKMELARLASIGVVENLRPIDLVGVLIFDNSFQWTVPIRKAEDRPLIKRLVAGITPDGGTQIAPALSEAYRRVLPQNAVYKHIVLLTDGISEEGDSIPLAREAAANRVTISTVGLGQDVNRAYLEKVASFSKGKSYFLNDPSGLEQILLRDVMEHTGSTSVEKAVRAGVAKSAEILDGVAFDQAPPLRGYVRFIARPTADTILNVDQKDPLFVRWQFGLGRAAVFTSDIKNRWASQWLTWGSFDRLWANVFRDLLPHAKATEAVSKYDSANDELVVDYRLGRYVEEPQAIPDIFALGPDGFQQPVKVAKMAAGNYRARVRIGRRQGLFRVRPLADSPAFPEAGFYRQEDELAEFGSNEFVLRKIAESTGGVFKPSVRRIFQADGRSIPSTLQLWPGLLAAAVALNLAELILRKLA